MTTGSNSNSNHRALHPRDDREALSALFDGELPSDAARFALKRLDHDLGWRETCGRWQLLGDTLRGEAIAVAPNDFAAGVMRALLEERRGVQAAPAPAQATAAPVRAVSRRWLGGAALAASVAVAAVLVVRPFESSTSRSSEPAVVAQSSGAQPVVSPTVQGAAIGVAPAADPIAQASVAGPALATAETSDEPAHAMRRPVRSNVRVATPGSREASAQARSEASRIEAVAAATPGTSSQPFHPPADTIVTRPWPRSVLSESPAAGAFTVSLGQESTAAPSLYPFEPRLSQNPPNRTEPAEPQR
ncbi:sigma-E factor negative regulatory protein [Lysobacter terrae]